jgi:hypothetical protein
MHIHAAIKSVGLANIEPELIVFRHTRNGMLDVYQ